MNILAMFAGFMFPLVPVYARDVLEVGETGFGMLMGAFGLGGVTGTLLLATAGKVEKKGRVVIATGQLVGEGFDCPNLTTLFLATPVSFSGRVLQYIGRVLRPAPGKSHARIFDYVDVNVEPLVKAARARQRVYGPDIV